MIDSVSNSSYAAYSFSSNRSKTRDPAEPENALEKTALQDDPSAKAKKSKDKKGANGIEEKLDPAEKQQVRDLKARDTEVRTHEMAHLAAAGSLAMGGPNYVYQTGPDGKQYAIGGDVKIDTSKGRTPEETIQKARQIRAAALAPSDPSPQDIKVAASAAAMEAEAVSKLGEKNSKSSGDAANDKSGSDTDEEAEGGFTISSIRQASSGDASSGFNSPRDQDAPSQNAYLEQAAALYRRAGSN